MVYILKYQPFLNMRHCNHVLFKIRSGKDCPLDCSWKVVDYSDLRGNTSRSLPIESWLSCHGKSQGRRHIFGIWLCEWSPEAATLGDSLVTLLRRNNWSRRKSRCGLNMWRWWPVWCTKTRIHPMMFYKILSSRSGIFPRASSQWLGRLFIQSRRLFRNPS